MGREYVIEHIISALKQETKDKSFRLYVAECLRMITKSAAISAQCMSGGNEEAAYMSMSYHDIVDGLKKPEDTRSADEIISGFLSDFGGKEENE